MAGRPAHICPAWRQTSTEYVNFKMEQGRKDKMQNTDDRTVKPAGRAHRLVARLWLPVILALLPEAVLASPFKDGSNPVTDILTGGIVRSAGVIGVAIFVWLIWQGRISPATGTRYIAGTVLISGGPSIIEMIIGPFS